MLMPDSDPIPCPICQTPIRMTLQAALRARDLGVAIECPECGGAWLYHADPTPRFGPLVTPKRRRGRPPKSQDDELNDGLETGRE